MAAGSDSSGVVRESAVEALVSCGSPNVLDALSQLASSAFSIPVRLGAIRGLGNIYSAAATQVLSGLLTDDAGQLKAEAVEALARQGSTKQPDVFVVMLRDSDPVVIAAAAKAIGEFRLPSGGPLLVDLLRGSPNGQVRRESAAALGKLGDRRFTASLATVARSRSEQISVRLAAIRSLGLIGDLQAAESLIALLKDPEAIIRVAAARSCTELRSYDASPIIRELLRNETREARSELIQISGLWPEEFKASLQQIVLA